MATLAAGQTGRIGFESPTPSSVEFLRGTGAGPPAVIWGDLALPPGGAARLPAVVLVHGSGGVGATVEHWAEDLAGLGLATLILDSLTGRGIAETGTDQSRLSMFAMIRDAYRALELLSAHPRIDLSRIGS